MRFIHKTSLLVFGYSIDNVLLNVVSEFKYCQENEDGLKSQRSAFNVHRHPSFFSRLLPLLLFVVFSLAAPPQQYLGVFFTPNLKWDSHVDVICSRAFNKFGSVERILKCSTGEVKLIAYKFLGRPILEHGRKKKCRSA